MEIRIQGHEGKELTGYEMANEVKNYFQDLGNFLSWTFEDWFQKVSFIPYESDDNIFELRPIETVARPALLLDRQIFPSLDCKKKSILIACWAQGNGYPWRFIAISEKPNKKIHHVFTQINFGIGFENCDAVLPHYRPGQFLPNTTFAQELAK